MEKPHKFDIGEGYGIWTDLDGETHRSFPEEFFRAKSGDSAGQYKIGDFAIMNQPTTKQRFGMFVIANVETGDFGGTGLKYKITVKPYRTPEEIKPQTNADRPSLTLGQDGKSASVSAAQSAEVCG